MIVILLSQLQAVECAFVVGFNYLLLFDFDILVKVVQELPTLVGMNFKEFRMQFSQLCH